MRPFVAWDGEALGGEGAEPCYALLACSGVHPALWNPSGLRSAECLDWLLGLSEARPGIHVAYGSAYDVNMILGDLDKPTLEELFATGRAEWSGYRLGWIPGRVFEIWDAGGRYHKTHDAYGFFQCSFVKALEEWGLEAPAFLRDMKLARGEFTAADREQLERYSASECQLLEQLMEELRAQLRQQGLKLHGWHGAGAVASTMLRKAQVKKHKTPGRSPALDEAILASYFGGRTEMFKQGVVASATQLDLNSAYAWALAQAPTGHGAWRRAREYQPEARYALWRADWDLNDENEILAPLPFRNGRAIYYPVRGGGWYHAEELRAALALYPERIQPRGGYTFEPSDDTLPFEFLREWYGRRKQLGQQPVARTLKFGLASAWGKTAQATRLNQRVPPYQDYFWSGYATQLVRATMLRAAALHRDTLIQINTDSLLLAGRSHELAPQGSGMGEWRQLDLYHVFAAQPGVVDAYECEDGSRAASTRGFFSKELDFEVLRRVWEEHGPLGTLHTEGTRFYGLGTCLALGSYAHWRQWVRTPQKLTLYASRKYYGAGEGGMLVQLLPPYEVRPGLSDLYQPKIVPLEARPDLLEWIQGNEQPMLSF